MKIALALLLNAALLALLLPWLRRQWQWAAPNGWHLVLAAGLALRVVVGVARSWSVIDDPWFMSNLAHRVTAQLWAAPVTAWRTMTSNIAVFPIYSKSGVYLYDTAYQALSNTWFMIRVLALTNLASLELTWLNGLYLSLFAFVGCWQLARKLVEIFPRTPPGAGMVAFLLWPSVWFWATGLSKEALLLGSGTWLVARVLGGLYGEPANPPAGWWPPAKWWLGTAALAFLHFKMRYFFAVPLFGVLLGVALGRWLQVHGLVRRRWAKAGALLAVLAGGLWLAPQVSVAFRMNKFTNQMVLSYGYGVRQSAGKPHLEYPNLRPTAESIAAHVPLAVFNTLARPFIGESRQPRLVGAALENVLIISLLGLALTALLVGRAGSLPFELGVGLGIFCVVLALLIGLTTPSLGTLHRYRSSMLPFLLLLLLQNQYVAQWLRRLGFPPSRQG